MSEGAGNELERGPIDQIQVGSVVIPIYFAPVTIKVGDRGNRADVLRPGPAGQSHSHGGTANLRNE